jgi:hypothetical protein
MQTQDFFEVTMPDGIIHKRKGTRWRNPTDRPVRLELPYQGPEFHFIGDGPARLTHAARYLHTGPDGALAIAEIRGGTGVNPPPKVTIPPHGEVTLPSDFDQAIQDARCTECTRGRSCTERSHRKLVVGGEGPMLVRADGPAELHPSLSTTTPQTAPAHDAQDARLLARVRGGGR